MCILLSTTENANFPFILISNRDEYFKRPTQRATFRNIHDKRILSPLDLGRPEHGSWIGVDDTGRIAVLVNYREAGDLNLISDVSRGILPIDYISSTVDDDTWFENLETSLATRISGREFDKVPLRRIGGFSLLYGKLSLNENQTINKLNIISNRGDKGTVYDVEHLSNDKLHMNETTLGLSNSLFYEPWDKVKLGCNMLHELMINGKDLSQDQLVESLFDILSTNSFDESLKSKPFIDQLIGLRSTIFVPPLDSGDGNNDTLTTGRYYGTRTQTVILLDKHNTLHYYERNLHNSDSLTDEPNHQYFKVHLHQ